jgi:hypothetical protein
MTGFKQENGAWLQERVYWASLKIQRWS